MMETTSNQRKLGIIGRYMMDCAVTEKCDEKSNRLSVVGDKLTRFGATFGTSKKSFTNDELILIQEYMKEALNGSS